MAGFLSGLAAADAQDAASVPAPISAPETPPKKGFLSGLAAADAQDAGLPSYDPSLSSLAASPAVGANRLLKTAISAPGDLLGYGLAALTGDQSYRGAGSRAASTEMGAVGVDPDTAQHLPRSSLEAALQAGGEGAAGMFLPEAALAGVSRAGVEMSPLVGSVLQKTFGSAESAPAVVKNAIIGGVGGTAGDLAAQPFDPAEHPYLNEAAGLAGNLLGGGLAAVTSEAHPWNMLKSFKAPLTNNGVEQIAGQQLRDASMTVNPEGQVVPASSGVIDEIENGQRELVPGSPTTTFQLTGNMGLGSLERGYAAQNPELATSIRGTQNSKRLGVLGGLQTAGTPEDVSAGLRANLDALDAATASDVGTANQTAANAASATGGNQSADFYGNQIGAAIKPGLDLATQNAAEATGALGGSETPVDYGTALRDPYQAQTEALRVKRNALYKAIDDPANPVNIVTSNLRNAADTEVDKLSSMAKPPKEEEAAIMDELQSLPDVSRFSDLQVLDTRISTAMSEEKGRTPVWGRLLQMRQAVRDTIDNGVANQVAYERDRVASGAMSPDDTLQARVDQWGSDFSGEQQGGLASGAKSASQVPASGETSASGVSGATSEAGSGPASAASGEGLSPPTGGGANYPLRERIQRAYAASPSADEVTAPGKWNRRVPISEIRSRLPNVDPAALDAELTQMHLNEPGFHMSGADNPAEFRKHPEWQAGGATFKGEPMNFAWQIGEPNYSKIARASKKPSPSTPETLLAFLKRRGGVKDDRGELTAMGLNRSYPGLVNNRSGFHLDDARRAAVEQGYMGADRDRLMGETTVSDFLDAISDHPRYSVEDERSVFDAADAQKKQAFSARVENMGREIDAHLAAHGESPLDPEWRSEVATRLLNGGSTNDIDGEIERAAISLYEKDAEQARIRRETPLIPESEYEAAYSPTAINEAAGRQDQRGPYYGDEPGPQGGSIASQSTHGSAAGAGRESKPRIIQQSGLEPNFDDSVAARLTAAKKANVEYKANQKGPLGGITETTFPGGSEYKMPAAAVPDKVFAKGGKGYEAGMEYRRAVRDDPEAISAAHNYAAMTLRRWPGAIRPDGTIDPARFSSWREAYSDALRAFPGLEQKFSTAAKASSELSKFQPFRADMAPYSVPEVFFHAGPSGKEGVDNLRRLIGDDRAESILTDYAASKLRPDALQKDGTLDPKVVAHFQKTHAEALSSFPALNDKFSTAAKATETAQAATELRNKILDTYQAGAVGKIMKAAPEDVVKQVGSVLSASDGAAQMGRLAEAARRAGPDAVAGLRKAVAEHVVNRFVSNTEAATSQENLLRSDQFQTFMRNSRGALSKVLTPEETASLDGVAADLHRANRSVTAVKLPGSNTTQDTASIQKRARKPEGSLLSAILVGAGLGHEAHGVSGAVMGALSGVAKHAVGGARAVGYEKADALVRDALLKDPDLAARLMRKAPVVAPRTGEPTLGQKLSRVAAYSAINSLPLRADGGRVEVNTAPTEKQKAVGNYKKGHIRVHGLNVTIENPKGSFREGISRDGKKWRVRMLCDYGYVLGTVGADQDHLDMFVGPNDNAPKVFVVDQRDLGTRKFDEHKVLAGFKNREAAIGAYCNSFSDGKGCKRMMKITPMTVDEFKAWLESGKTKEPIGKAA